MYIHVYPEASRSSELILYYNCSAQTHTSDTTEYNTHERHCGHYKRSVTLSGCARRGASRSHTIILVHAGSRAMSDTYLFNRTR